MEDKTNGDRTGLTGPPSRVQTVKVDGPGPGSRNIPWTAMMTLVIGAFMAILDSSIVNVALPKLMAVFGVGAESIQWVATAYMLVSGMVVPVTGYLCDRFGSKRMYIFSLAVFTIGSGLCALAWNNNTLIAARVIQAIGGGMIMPVSMSMIYAIVPIEKMGLAMGIWGISAMAAPTIGPTLGGYLVDHMGWEWIFTVNLPVGVASIFLSGMLLNETPRRANLKLDIIGAVLSATACFTLLLAMSEGQDKGWTSLYIVNLIIVSVFSFILFILWELSTPQPLLDLRILKNKTLSYTLLGVTFTTIGLFSAMFLVPLFTQNILGYTPMQTGLLMMPAALTTGIMMPISGRLFDKIGALPLCLSGMLIMTITTYQLHSITTDTSYSHLQWLLVKRAVGMGLAMMPFSTAGMNTVPRFLVARAAALNNLMRQISASLGIAFLTYQMLHRQTLHTAWLAETVNYNSPAAMDALSKLQGIMSQAGGGPQAAAAGATSMLSMLLQRQAFVAGITDAFIISSVITAMAIPFTLFLSKKAVAAETIKQSRQFAHLAPPGMGRSPAEQAPSVSE